MKDGTFSASPLVYASYLISFDRKYADDYVKKTASFMLLLRYFVGSLDAHLHISVEYFVSKNFI